MPRRSAGIEWLATLGLIGGVGLVAYRYAVGPWQRRWGATDDEVAAVMPGDALVAGANFASTRAITISARPEQVWPWLAQMGQNRGGLYSYTALENLLGLNFHNADRIVPEWQDLKVGDPIPVEPGGSGYRVAALEPNQHLVLFADLTALPGMEATEAVSTWVFTLRGLDGPRTRLVIRWRMRFLGWKSRNPVASLIQLALDPMEFIMERKMLLGIRERAEVWSEGRGVPRAAIS